MEGVLGITRWVDGGGMIVEQCKDMCTCMLRIHICVSS